MVGGEFVTIKSPSVSSAKLGNSINEEGSYPLRSQWAKNNPKLFKRIPPPGKKKKKAWRFEDIKANKGFI